ncbi:cell division protein FtsQ/DivIB, partial [Abiotrophia defectiva]
MANYRLDQRSRYQEDYQENRQTLNQRRQPSRQRSQGNYRLDANGQPVMRPNQDRQRPRPYQEEHYNYEEAQRVPNQPDFLGRRQGNHRIKPYGTQPSPAWTDYEQDYETRVVTKPRAGNYRQTPHHTSLPNKEKLSKEFGQARWPKGKMKLFSVFVVLVLSLAVVGYRLLPTHYVNAVQIVGNQRVDGEAIVAASGIRDFDRVKDIMAKRKSIEQAIMKENPLVSKVTLRRPNMQSLQLEIEEHAIVAKIKSGDQWIAVLDNGTWGDFSASVAAKEAVNLDQLPELLVQAPSGRVTELTTMLKQTPPDILSQIESLKLGQEASKNSAFEAKMRDGNLVKAVLPTFNHKMTFYNQMLKELGDKKGTLNL